MEWYDGLCLLTNDCMLIIGLLIGLWFNNKNLERIEQTCNDLKKKD